MKLHGCCTVLHSLLKAMSALHGDASYVWTVFEPQQTAYVQENTYYVANMQAFVVSSIIQRYSLMQAAALTFLEASQQEVIQ